MRITTKKQILLDSLHAVIGAVAQKNTLPILSNLLIECNSTSLTITATDLDIGITHTQEAGVVEQGSVTVPAKKFFDIIKELPDEDINILTKKNNTIHITAGNSIFKILTTPKDEFPNIPTPGNTSDIVIGQKILKEMLLKTSFAMSKEETRYVLNGICVETQQNKLQLIATDGRRLAIINKPAKIKETEQKRYIIPSKTIQELQKILSEEGDIVIKLTNNQILFNTQNTQIISRLIEGEFPNYQQAIPAKTGTFFTVTTEKLAPAIRRAGLFTTTESQAITLHLTKNKLTLTKTTPEIGETTETVDVVYAGAEIQIGFNPAYLLDVLKNIHTETITMELTGPEKPGVLRVGDEYIYIVLPMQIT